MNTLDKFNKQDKEVIDIVNRNFAKVRHESIKQAQEQEKIKYQPRSKSKQKDYFKKDINGIVASLTILGVGNELVKNANEYTDMLEFNNRISQSVIDNTYYPGSLQEDGKPAIAYVHAQVAKDILEKNKELDIDTRIYGAYNQLNEHEKDYNMDLIMQELQKLVTSTPLEYTEDEVRACNHSSFDDYLVSLGMDKDEYLSYMREVKLAYSQNDLTKVEELLTQLTGGGR